MKLRWILGLAILCAPAGAASLRLDARTVFDRAVSTHVNLSSDGSALELDSGEVYEDDGPASGFSYRPNLEKLSSSVWIRKQLLIADPRASAAALVVGGSGSFNVAVNGRPQTLEKPRAMALGQWRAYAINPAALKPGVNDIVMWGAGEVGIARSDDSYVQLPKRSARSADGGVSWSNDRLGPGGNISGEYYVRVFLEHHRAKGSIVLPVMDVANLQGNPLAPPLDKVGAVRVSVQAETRSPSDVLVRVRSGSTYVPGKTTWSEWMPLDRSGTLRNPRGRFVQVEVSLATGDPLVTPRLREITIEAAPVLAADWTKGFKVVDAHNEEIVRTSVPFRYESFNHPKLKELRERYGLDKVVSGANTELELVSKLTAWAARQWKWREWHLAESYPAWDALEILKTHADGKPVGGFCLQYDVVLMQACESFGLPGRMLSTSPGSLGEPKGIGGHEPGEIWSNQYRKWVYMDGTGAWYAVDSATGVPLSLWELRRRQVQLVRGQPSDPIRIVVLEETPHHWLGLKEGANTLGQRWQGFAELRLIPRSNFLEQQYPVPLNQGYTRAWYWDGYYVWSDADTQAELLHSTRVTRRGNFEWTLNQAHYLLEAGSKRGEILVHLDTETPGFETFLAEIDGAAKRPVSAVFPWKLHPGSNRMKVWPRNNAGRDGIASWLELNVPTS